MLDVNYLVRPVTLIVAEQNGQGGLSLRSDASQVVVTEAKMFSKLSAGVTNARYFNQAARNVACIAEIIYRANLRPQDLSSIGFYVVAPKERIDEGVFSQAMDSSDIRAVVGKRVSEYEEPEKRQWLEEHFEPLKEVISLRSISWEEILSIISTQTPDEGAAMGESYK